MNREQLKKISRCRICMKKRHWTEACTAGSRDTKKVGLTAFSCSGNSTSASSAAFSFLSGKCFDQFSEALETSWNFLTFSANEAIVDIGAIQDLIGVQCLKRLEEVRRSRSQRSARGGSFDDSFRHWWVSQSHRHGPRSGFTWRPPRCFGHDSFRRLEGCVPPSQCRFLRFSAVKDRSAWQQHSF